MNGCGDEGEFSINRKICASLLVLAILCVTSCSKKNISSIVTTSLVGKTVLVGNIPCKFPIVTKHYTLNALVTGHNHIPYGDVFVCKKYEEMTGIKINWTTVDYSERDEAVYFALANKKDFDLIMRCRIPANKLTQYGEKGLILDLAKDDMLKKNAPNCWAYLQSHPETLASVTNPNGTIYSIPQVNSGAELRVSRKIFINKRWLEKVNMEIPKTTEELYHVLVAFKEQDANGNGDPNDEIPFCPHDWLSTQDVFYGAFGLVNRGTHNRLVDCDEGAGKVRLIASCDAYKDYLKYLNRLYSEGLMDRYVFTMTFEQWINNMQNDKCGIFANTNLAWISADKVNDWVAVEEALEGPRGDKIWTAVRANFHSTGAAVIPSTCKNPELVLQWLDYFWTDEGTLFYHMGIQNDTFIVKEDGSYDYSPKIYDEMKSSNKTFDDVIATYSPYPGGCNPTVEIAPYFKGGEMAEVPAKAARKLFKYAPKEFWPSFTFTTEENDALERIQTDMEKYITAMRIEFISGEKPFREWDDYISQLDKFGQNKLLEIYQAALDRYKKTLVIKK